MEDRVLTGLGSLGHGLHGFQVLSLPGHLWFKGSPEIASPASFGLVGTTLRRIGLHLPQLSRSHLSLSISRLSPLSVSSLYFSPPSVSPTLFVSASLSLSRLFDCARAKEGRTKKEEEKRRKKEKKRKKEKDPCVREEERGKERKEMARDTWHLVSGWEGIVKSTPANWVKPRGKDRILFIKRLLTSINYIRTPTI
jgi:hypothetical protein